MKKQRLHVFKKDDLVKFYLETLNKIEAKENTILKIFGWISFLIFGTIFWYLVFSWCF